MGAMALAMRLLPLLIRSVELALGARNGEVKRDLVLDLVFGVLALVAPNAGTPEMREALGLLVDQIVGVLNGAGVFTRSAKA